MTMKNVLTLFKTPNLVQAFSRLENIQQNEDQTFSPHDVFYDFINFLDTFFDDEPECFVSASCPCCDPDLNAYRLSKVIDGERYVIEVRKERYELDSDGSFKYEI